MSKNPPILILGNGFDLAHYLPTKYEHFIHAMSVLENLPNDKGVTFEQLFKTILDYEKVEIQKSKDRNDDNPYEGSLTRTFKMYNTDDAIFSANEANELRELLKSNGWFQYFKSYVTSSVNSWIDFEQQIQKVLQITCVSLFSLEDRTKIFRKEKDFFTFKQKEFKDQDFPIIVLKNTFTKLKIIDDFEHPLKNSGTIRYDNLKIRNLFVSVLADGVFQINKTEILMYLDKQLKLFNKLFEKYILLLEKLTPKNRLEIPPNLKCDIPNDAIYSFNYSKTLINFYQAPKIHFLHGEAKNSKEDNIVLGISELDGQILKNEKAYGFTKYYQKLINNTDYHFLKYNQDLIELEDQLAHSPNLDTNDCYDIYIWGHSLDASDSEYVNEIFSFNKGSYGDFSKPRDIDLPTVKVTVFYFPTPHAQLANLIHILGKDLVETWMKNGWLKFEKSPDIYNLNFGNESAEKEA